MEAEKEPPRQQILVMSSDEDSSDSESWVSASAVTRAPPPPPRSQGMVLRSASRRQVPPQQQVGAGASSSKDKNKGQNRRGGAEAVEAMSVEDGWNRDSSSTVAGVGDDAQGGNGKSRSCAPEVAQNQNASLAKAKAKSCVVCRDDDDGGCSGGKGGRGGNQKRNGNTTKKASKSTPLQLEMAPPSSIGSMPVLSPQQPNVGQGLGGRRDPLSDNFNLITIKGEEIGEFPLPELSQMGGEMGQSAENGTLNSPPSPRGVVEGEGSSASGNIIGPRMETNTDDNANVRSASPELIELTSSSDEDDDNDDSPNSTVQESESESDDDHPNTTAQQESVDDPPSATARQESVDDPPNAVIQDIQESNEDLQNSPVQDESDDDSESEEDEDHTELHHAVDRKDEEAIKKLIREGAYIDAENKYQQTPLFRAAIGEDKVVCLRIIKYLIDHGANVFADDEMCCTFVHELVACGTTLTLSQFHDISRFLIGKKVARIFNHADDDCKSTPLHWAVQNLEVRDETLALLYKHGVNLNATYDQGNSVLTAALRGGRSTRFLSYLIKLGANWKHLNEHRQNLLHLAAEFGNVEGLKFFLNCGLDVNLIDLFWDTPLHQAAHFGTENLLETVTLLIEKGAEVGKVNNKGLTPLGIISEREDIDGEMKGRLAELLDEQGVGAVAVGVHVEAPVSSEVDFMNQAN